MPNDKIHILHAIRQGKIGGGETYILQLIDGMDSSIYQHSVLSFTDGPMIHALMDKGIQCIIIPIRKAFHFSSFSCLLRLLNSIRPDIIHVHGSRAASNLVPVARLLKIPVLYTIHGWSFHPGQSRIYFHLRRIAENWITRHTTLNINVSYADQQSGQYYLNKFNSVVVRNGVDLNKFTRKYVTSHIRPELAIPDDAVVISFVARMTTQKNPFLLLNAFEKALYKIDHQIFLILVGDGELMSDISAWLASHNLLSYVRLLGFRQDIPDILAATDIYCLPSLWEGLPIGLLEAMAMENAIVVSDIPPHREVIKNGHNGLLFAPQDHNSLASLLLQLCSSRDLRSRLQMAARHTVETEFNVIHMIHQMEDIYERIVDPTKSIVHIA
ncbi:glycosyltransferase [Thermoflavifilum thermophilum]|uniref:Glycosyltransferase involved in cell wall bisynthesis n=1 Tax=Thermoflavifilum thermophilum TaxID=1393122 RepID=A0A1I7NE97_9BACT|nr:glycosyltransferase [Thermoflavifilum thermophilum]SFV32997.1 Glycosyltransferase involved in cell wall bisynthesis [Thermoflavifilum thermophilum]